MNTFDWLVGLVLGDGWIDDRHVEIYNSSPSVVSAVVKALVASGVPLQRIKADVTSNKKPDLSKWAKVLSLPVANLHIRENHSTWQFNAEKVRIRVASKDLASKIARRTEEFLKSPKSKLIGFRYLVNGLFDAEGSVDVKGYVEFKQEIKNGRHIVEQVFETLKFSGIDSTHPKTKKDAKKVDAYFYVRDMRTYLQKIGFVDESKTTKARSVISAIEQGNVPDEKQVINCLNQPQTIFQLMSLLACPYHRIRPLVNKLLAERKVTRQREGLEFLFLSSQSSTNKVTVGEPAVRSPPIGYKT